MEDERDVTGRLLTSPTVSVTCCERKSAVFISLALKFPLPGRGVQGGGGGGMRGRREGGSVCGGGHVET